ncbi:GtrA family protein [Candidatus Enterococcus willemsii]|uniref:Teichoic acid glycosylation protein n=1 Tax=Candidatus Enterococcus willemsii TaxID=1857215 RepID=A0ABQ6Z314_9ENTE|nr:GtrA family protein [Enterococcus sp. CU12B]KAF1306217.1 teichoic acid glycosylation protein [Enterococcus sp. CU12B]
MKEVFLYIFFGGLTTVVNFVVYFIARDLLKTDLIVSNTLSWIAAVLFAFITNKIWVFQSKTQGIIELLIELLKFVFYRLLSFGIDMGCMLLFINVMHLGDFLSKLFTQVFIVIANYVFSKLFIFKKKTVSSKESTKE